MSERRIQCVFLFCLLLICLWQERYHSLVLLTSGYSLYMYQMFWVSSGLNHEHYYWFDILDVWTLLMCSQELKTIRPNWIFLSKQWLKYRNISIIDILYQLKIFSVSPLISSHNILHIQRGVPSLTMLTINCTIAPYFTQMITIDLSTSYYIHKGDTNNKDCIPLET